MRVVRVQVGPLETNCWVVSDDIGGPVVVIDPGAEADVVLSAVGDRKVSSIVLTHAHFDHIGAAGQVVEATGAPLLAHAIDAKRLTSSEAGGTGGAIFGFHVVAPQADRELEDGDTVTAGELSMRVLHTPGHTQGGICLFAEDPQGGSPHLFSGDTLFAGSVGRSDFPGGDARALSWSVAEKLAPLPQETRVHPGHGPDTTLGRESMVNPFWPKG